MSVQDDESLGIPGLTCFGFKIKGQCLDSMFFYWWFLQKTASADLRAIRQDLAQLGLTGDAQMVQVLPAVNRGRQLIKGVTARRCLPSGAAAAAASANTAK